MIKIGSSDTCHIRFREKNITGSVWATITASDNNMLVLQLLDKTVRCTVNRNDVTGSYWIKYGDEIRMNGHPLDWILINQLLAENNVSSNRERNLTDVAPLQSGNSSDDTNSFFDNSDVSKKADFQSTVYGPPVVGNKTRSFQSTVYGLPLVRKIKWKLISIIVLILGAIIGLLGYYLGPDKRSMLYGPPPPSDKNDQLYQFLKQKQKELDSLSTLEQKRDSLLREKMKSTLYGPKPINKK